MKISPKFKKSLGLIGSVCHKLKSNQNQNLFCIGSNCAVSCLATGSSFLVSHLSSVLVLVFYMLAL